MPSNYRHVILEALENHEDFSRRMQPILVTLKFWLVRAAALLYSSSGLQVEE